MASIGSGPGIGSGPKLEVNAVRAVSTTDTGATAQAAVSNEQAPAANSPVGATMVATTALNAGQAPVDTDRVATIKKAIESGNYPIVPTKISDAIIAAGLMLRVAK